MLVNKIAKLFLKINLIAFFVLVGLFVGTKTVSAHAPTYEGWVKTSSGVGIPCVWIRQGDGQGNFRYTQTGGSSCNVTTPTDISASGFPTLRAGDVLPVGMYALQDLDNYTDTQLSTMAATPIDTNFDGTDDHKILEMIYTFTTAYGQGFGCVADPQKFSAILPSGWTGSFSIPAPITINNTIDNVSVEDIIYTGTIGTVPSPSPSVPPSLPPSPPPSPLPSVGPLVPPNTPTKVCDFTSGNPVCDNGFASPSRPIIAARNTGPANSAQPEIIFFTLNNILGATNTITGNPFNTNVSQVGSVNVTSFAGVPMIDGDMYNWTVGAVASDFQISPPESPAMAWHFTWDSIPPNIALFSSITGCILSSSAPATIEVRVDDPGINASGIQSVFIKVNGIVTPATLETGRSDGLTDIYSIPFSLSGFGVYTVSARAIDRAGNIRDFSPVPLWSFLYTGSACVGPWIQTKNGDVHSNIDITIPGGP